METFRPQKGEDYGSLPHKNVVCTKGWHQNVAGNSEQLTRLKMTQAPKGILHLCPDSTNSFYC